jgi:hypothetical protein
MRTVLRGFLFAHLCVTGFWRRGVGLTIGKLHGEPVWLDIVVLNQVDEHVDINVVSAGLDHLGEDKALDGAHS